MGRLGTSTYGEIDPPGSCQCLGGTERTGEVRYGHARTNDHERATDSCRTPPQPNCWAHAASGTGRSAIRSSVRAVYPWCRHPVGRLGQGALAGWPWQPPGVPDLGAAKRPHRSAQGCWSVRVAPSFTPGCAVRTGRIKTAVTTGLGIARIYPPPACLTALPHLGEVPAQKESRRGGASHTALVAVHAVFSVVRERRCPRCPRPSGP
jgi:hypothetical protein